METSNKPKRGSTIVKIPVLFGDDTFKVANSVLRKIGWVEKLVIRLGTNPQKLGNKYLKKVEEK